MPQSLSKVYVHIVFSTKHRFRKIDREIEKPLFEYLGGICRKLECNPVQIGGYQNHVHILCLLSRKITQMKLLEEVKKSSSKWIKTKGETYHSFYWQDGYGIFSISSTHVPAVIHYIQNQRKHHTKSSFKDEFRELIKKYQFQYDERYVWD